MNGDASLSIPYPKLVQLLQDTRARNASLENSMRVQNSAFHQLRRDSERAIRDKEQSEKEYWEREVKALTQRLECSEARVLECEAKLQSSEEHTTPNDRAQHERAIKVRDDRIQELDARESMFTNMIDDLKKKLRQNQNNEEPSGNIQQLTQNWKVTERRLRAEVERTKAALKASQDQVNRLNVSVDMYRKGSKETQSKAKEYDRLVAADPNMTQPLQHRLDQLERRVASAANPHDAITKQRDEALDFAERLKQSYRALRGEFRVETGHRSATKRARGEEEEDQAMSSGEEDDVVDDGAVADLMTEMFGDDAVRSGNNNKRARLEDGDEEFIET